MEQFSAWHAGARGRAAVVALLALAVGGAGRPALSQTAAAPDTSAYTIGRRVFKAGDINRYKLNMKSHDGETDSLISLQVKETTRDAKPTGEFTLLNQFEAATAKVGLEETDIKTLLPNITVNRDKQGNLSNKTEGGNDLAGSRISAIIQPMSTVQDNFLPSKPVKVGDKWPISVVNTGAGGVATKTSGEATFVGTEVVAGIKSVKFRVVSELDNKQEDVKAHSDSTLNIDPATGRLLKMSAKIEGIKKGLKIAQELEYYVLPSDSK